MKEEGDETLFCCSNEKQTFFSGNEDSVDFETQRFEFESRGKRSQQELYQFASYVDD